MNEELREEMEVLKEELAEAEQARRNNIEILSRELEKAYVSQTHAQSEIARLETENKRLNEGLKAKIASETKKIADALAILDAVESTQLISDRVSAKYLYETVNNIRAALKDGGET